MGVVQIQHLDPTEFAAGQALDVFEVLGGQVYFLQQGQIVGDGQTLDCVLLKQVDLLEGWQEGKTQIVDIGDPAARHVDLFQLGHAEQREHRHIVVLAKQFGQFG